MSLPKFCRRCNGARPNWAGVGAKTNRLQSPSSISLAVVASSVSEAASVPAGVCGALESAIADFGVGTLPYVRSGDSGGSCFTVVEKGLKKRVSNLKRLPAFYLSSLTSCRHRSDVVAAVVDSHHHHHRLLPISVNWELC